MLPTEHNEAIAELGTETQRTFYKAYCEQGNKKKAAEALGKAKSTVWEGLKLLEKKAVSAGYLEACNEKGVAGEGRYVGKVTTHIKDGEIQQQWIRTDSTKEDAAKYIKLMVDALSMDVLGKSPISEAPRYTSSNLLSMYGLFDRHVGMMAWAEETGGDSYDLKLSEKLEGDVGGRLIASQPSSKEALVVFGGDYLHCDDDQQVTPAHKNKLEVDGRSDKVFQVAIRIAERMINMASEKHEHVTVIVLPGNHDPVLSMALKHVLIAFYSNNDRVDVMNAHGVFGYHRFGTTLLAFHHGDKCKSQKLYEVISTDRRADWSEVEFVDAYSGHWHTEQVSNIGIVRFETLTTPIPNDAYASSNGYRSRRCAHAITYDLYEGMIGRTVHNITNKKK